MEGADDATPKECPSRAAQGGDEANIMMRKPMMAMMAQMMEKTMDFLSIRR